jgi:hypothetical protein
VKIAQLLNFTLSPSGRGYISDDPKNLFQRVINVIKVLIKKQIEEMPLRDALKSSEKLPQIINEGMLVNFGHQAQPGNSQSFGGYHQGINLKRGRRCHLYPAQCFG